MEIKHNETDSYLNEHKHTIRIFDIGGNESLRIESDSVATVIDSFNQIAQSWNWVTHPSMQARLHHGMRDVGIQAWPIGTATQWENGNLGTVQYYRGDMVR